MSYFFCVDLFHDKKPNMKTCLFDGCNNPIFSNGYCKRHQYMRTDVKKPNGIVFRHVKQRSEKKEY